MKKVIVIGGGAAGLIAAGVAAGNGNCVTVLERNPKPARKVCITGKGRCNLTNACTKDEFISNVCTNPRFLYSAVNAFSPDDTVALFESLGVRLKTERGNRVFPESDRALDAANALERFAKNAGAHISGTTVVSGLTVTDGAVSEVVTADGHSYRADAVILSTGGKSYPSTGSDGSGYALAGSVGHTVITPRPSLVPLCCDSDECKLLQGLSLRNVGVGFYKGSKLVHSDFGELLFTHFGVSGPVVLTASAMLPDISFGGYTLSIDLKPALDFDTLDGRLVRDFDKYSNREAANALSDLLPHSLIPVICSRWDIGSSRCNSVTREQRHALLSLLKDFRLGITGTRGFDEAIVTGGGVKVSEVSPNTMKSKLISNLYFCGEVLDVDALTGGFNLQIAFSTGYVAGMLG